MNKQLFSFFLILLLLVACRTELPNPDANLTPTEQTVATATVPVVATTPLPDPNPSFVTIATDAPFPPFEEIDSFGTIIGFDADIMANIASQADLEYEFIVTSYDEGFLESVAAGEFNAALSALLIPDTPPEGIVFTQPYLEVGQLLVVRANEVELQNYRDLKSDMRVGVVPNSSGEQTAIEQLEIPSTDLIRFNNTPQALQSLIDGNIRAVIIDSDDAAHFTATYFQQLKIVGGEGRDAWVSQKSYGIALAANNTPLLELLNQAIDQLNQDGTIDRLTRAWLIDDEPLVAGDSLIGTPANELVIGIAAQPVSLDPAHLQPDLVGWEILINSMSGLYWHTADNQLIPLLFEELTLSPDNKVYTFRLKEGLLFPDGSGLTAEDVRSSILRSARLGNWVVNAFLKDVNDDGFADEDAVVAKDDLTVEISLQEAISYFPSLLATPPYFVMNDDCVPLSESPTACAGIGPYTIQEWVAGERLQLKANPEWPGSVPAFENIQLRFYPSSERMHDALTIGAIDLAWTGLSDQELISLGDNSNLRYWTGSATFKSYLIFVHTVAPWNNPLVRQAAAYAIDRAGLAETVFNNLRTPLFSPLPDGVAGHVPAEPARDLEKAQDLLNQAGYFPTAPLPITFWYISDGRYSSVEESYANAIKLQLEETGIFQVTLQAAPWETFRNQKATCQYPLYLMGWPSPGQPVVYADGMSWLYYFLRNTETVCSNYQSPFMDTLLLQLEQLDPRDASARLAKYGEIQALWAEELPALDLTQTPRAAVASPTIKNVQIDALGILHYELLTKGGE